jgi:hypothetical protein
VVLVCILLVGNDDDEDRGELGGVDRFGVTEVSENRTFKEFRSLRYRMGQIDSAVSVLAARSTTSKRHSFYKHTKCEGC